MAHHAGDAAGLRLGDARSAGDRAVRRAPLPDAALPRARDRAALRARGAEVLREHRREPRAEAGARRGARDGGRRGRSRLAHRGVDEARAEARARLGRGSRSAAP